MKTNFHIVMLGLRESFRGEDELKRLQSKYKASVFWGFRGEDLSASLTNYSSEQAKFWFNRELTSGEIGCAFSHKEILLHFSNEPIDFLVVIEDDVKLDPKVDLQNLLQQLRQAELESMVLVCMAGKTAVSRRKLQLDGGRFEIARALSTPTSTQMLVFDKSALLAISEEAANRTLGATADFPPWYEDIVNFYVLTNPISISTGSETVIGEGRMNKRSNWLRKFGRMSMLAWIFQGRRYCSLRAYVRYVHGRAWAYRTTQ